MVLLLPIIGVVVAVVGLVVRHLAMARAVPVAARGSDRSKAVAVGPSIDALPPPLLEPAPSTSPLRREAPQHDEYQLATEKNQRRRWPRPSEDKLVLLVALTIYLVAAWLLAFRYESFHGDAQARLANAYYVLFSRDPHMAAIGFVWNPLPSFSVMPLLLLKGIVPALATRAFAANVMSAVFGAVAVQQLVVTLRESGVRRAPRLALGALFALHPMILYYSASGMSEAIFLLTLIVAARYLARWLDTGATGFLVASGVALAFAYLARNEAAMAAAAAGLVVFAVAATRATAPTRRRVLAGASEGVVFLAPFVTVFVGWAAVSWLIVGHPFEQFSSQYGNSSQLRVLGDSVRVASPVRFVTIDVLALAPLLPILVIVAIVRVVRRRDLRPLAPLSVLGGVLGFAVVGFLAGQTAPWWRYYITAVPLSVLVAGSLISSGARASTERRSKGGRTTRFRVKCGVAAVVTVAAAGMSLPATAAGLNTPSIGTEELIHLGFLLHGGHLTQGDIEQRDMYRHVVRMSKYLDGLHLPNGSILVDTFSRCVPPMILASRHPAKFVITNDRDFQPVLADPIAFHVPYILVPEPDGGEGSLNAINRAYPSLYETGGGFATLVRQLDGPGCSSFRLYHIDDGTQPTFQQSAPGATR